MEEKFVEIGVEKKKKNVLSSHHTHVFAELMSARVGTLFLTIFVFLFYYLITGFTELNKSLKFNQFREVFQNKQCHGKTLRGFYPRTPKLEPLC